jgi:hypothetical protein
MKLKRYKRFFKEIWIKINFKKIFAEEITLQDLSTAASISSGTNKYRKIRNKIKGTENKLAKYLELQINEQEDFVIAKFLTEGTHTFDVQTVTFDNGSVDKKDENVYEIWLKIEQIFSYLKTNPKNEITTQDIKDALKVCPVRVHCNCYAFLYQGSQYRLDQLDASIYHCDIPATTWEKLRPDNLLCKHSYGVIRQINFYIPQITMSLKKYLGLTKK